MKGELININLPYCPKLRWKKGSYLLNLHRFPKWIGVLALVLLISGCTGRPLLTKDNSYSIVTVSPDGSTQDFPIKLSWNNNFAVMQKLLLEASFVLSDLHTELTSAEDLDENSPPANFANTSDPDNASENPSENPVTFAPEDNPIHSKNEGAKDQVELTPESSTDNGSSDLIDQSDSINGSANPEGWFEENILKEFLLTEEQVNKEIPEFLTAHKEDTILLVAKFPEAKQFMLMIDNEEYLMDVTSIQVEIQGENPGRVVINQYINLQGIVNPNLLSAFADLLEMLENTKREVR